MRNLVYLAVDERRRLIIDAAVEVVVSEGLARATTRRVAERAGMPVGTLHYCFRDKEEMFLSILGRGQKTMRRTFEALEPTGGFERTLRASTAMYWEWIRDNPGLHLALMELLLWFIRNQDTLAPGTGDLWNMANAPFGGDLIQARLEEAAALDGTRPAVPVPELVRFLIHRMDGLVFELAETRDEDACARQTEMLADALVFLASRPAAPDSAPG